MLGFIVGTACLIGLVKVLRRGCGYGYGGYRGYGRLGGGCHGGGCHGGGGWGGGWHGGGWHGHHGGPGHFGAQGPWGDGGNNGARWMLRSLFERLQTTPGQERVILDAVEAVRKQGADGREALKQTAGDAARAFRGERFDEAVMGDAFARQDAALEAMQKAMFDALQKVHDALDERQRRELAEMMERGVGFFGRWNQGPYRY